MRTIYIDSDFHCHTANPDGIFREVETDFFNGKCQAFIEGFCYEIRENGVSIYAWKPYDELDSAQRAFEQALIVDMRNALNKLGVTLDE